MIFMILLLSVKKKTVSCGKEIRKIYRIFGTYLDNMTVVDFTSSLVQFTEFLYDSLISEENLINTSFFYFVDFTKN